MGTLFNQPPRSSQRFKSVDVEELIDEVKRISRDKKVSIDQVLKAMKILSLERRNELYTVNGDIFDEQMCGFGEIFERIENCYCEHVSFTDDL